MPQYSDELTLAKLLAEPAFVAVIEREAPQLDLAAGHPLLKALKNKKLKDLRGFVPNAEMKAQLARVEAALREVE